MVRLIHMELTIPNADRHSTERPSTNGRASEAILPRSGGFPTYPVLRVSTGFCVSVAIWRDWTLKPCPAPRRSIAAHTTEAASSENVAHRQVPREIAVWRVVFLQCYKSCQSGKRQRQHLFHPIVIPFRCPITNLGSIKQKLPSVLIQRFFRIV